MGDTPGQPGQPDLPEADVDPAEVDLAATWFLAARAMVAARGEVPAADEASAGLYAQAILDISEAACLAAKAPEHLGVMTLVDCLSRIRQMPHDVAEKIITGVMMLAYSDARMHPLEVRWTSMLTSAAGLTAEDLQRCRASARVIAGMIRPRTPDPSEATTA